ncbi:SHOCT domain-containing protein [Methanosarcina hadiensis]|uniref:SHOCT domain-containing protein n=1 Tax=Methanosarcina hadiensis TaxID=3078083 RepID=UPI0039774E24
MIESTEVIQFGRLIFWILVIVTAFILIKDYVNRNKPGDKGKSALDILKEKYAKGEIAKDEFEETKKKMRSITLICYTVLIAFLLYLTYLFFNGLIGTGEADLFKDIILVLIVLVNYLGRGLLND